ncbi:acyl-ACP thioesterase domain-containing protein [Clostridium sp. BJN0001]|uniref:acyl-[acyl-carrier-protein] thioesterase n=1 Tax=Clostridium sp. BJN0001 TaxID=2930219 RepID=UPI001FD34518|nr:acyl-ACP thioesterase domain-containing protein [Clostridium sp. BJN0001]
MIFEKNYRIGIEYIGRNNYATNKALLSIMEDIACLHSQTVHYGVLDIESKKKVWILLDWKIKVNKRPMYNDIVIAKTWPRKIKSLCAYRDFEIIDKGCNSIALGTSRWILMDTEKRRPIKITDDIKKLYEVEPQKQAFSEEIKDVRVNEFLFEKEFKIQRRDIDLNNHMHNLSYLDMAYEILPENIYKNSIFNNVRILYKKEIVYGSKIMCFYSKVDGKHIITVKSNDKKSAVIELY